MAREIFVQVSTGEERYLEQVQGQYMSKPQAWVQGKNALYECSAVWKGLYRQDKNIRDIALSNM